MNLYGGIYREAELILTGKTAVSPLHLGSEGVLVRQNSVTSALVEGEAEIYLTSAGESTCMLTLDITAPDGRKVFNKGLENHTETELEYVLIDPETAGVDVAHPRKLKLQDGRIPYTRTLFDEDALIFDNTQVERVGVEVDGKPYVTLTCKGFPSVGVWSKPKADAPFVCLEPWIGRCDNVGFDGELKDKYGEQHLKAGETFQAGYTITIGE